mmetsp:Transcript_52038/g.166693  ORF Transcript_52038/g.166693 Transcript_52038/m.166693 type:complete len:231 (+) Transcript_52038:476-1168(+)
MPLALLQALQAFAVDAADLVDAPGRALHAEALGLERLAHVLCQGEHPSLVLVHRPDLLGRQLIATACELQRQAVGGVLRARANSGGTGHRRCASRRSGAGVIEPLMDRRHSQIHEGDKVCYGGLPRLLLGLHAAHNGRQRRRPDTVMTLGSLATCSRSYGDLEGTFTRLQAKQAAPRPDRPRGSGRGRGRVHGGAGLRCHRPPRRLAPWSPHCRHGRRRGPSNSCRPAAL